MCNTNIALNTSPFCGKKSRFTRNIYEIANNFIFVIYECQCTYNGKYIYQKYPLLKNVLLKLNTVWFQQEYLLNCNILCIKRIFFNMVKRNMIFFTYI